MDSYRLGIEVNQDTIMKEKTRKKTRKLSFQSKSKFFSDS